MQTTETCCRMHLRVRQVVAFYHFDELILVDDGPAKAWRTQPEQNAFRRFGRQRYTKMRVDCLPKFEARSNVRNLTFQ
jgi:hypothetical protein